MNAVGFALKYQINTAVCVTAQNFVFSYKEVFNLLLLFTKSSKGKRNLSLQYPLKIFMHLKKTNKDKSFPGTI